MELELKVHHGPFKGMLYPKAESVGSSLIPKILGSYEKEISDLIETFCSNNYTDIVDIGCAEGYYANGFALRNPKANIYAFDTDPNARLLCEAMAKINNHFDRLTIGSLCTSDTLLNIPYRGKSLIFCDCEGYELNLFDELTIQNLKNHDFLIETHDFINIEISSKLESLFLSKDFVVKRFESIDDLKKARTYDIPEIRNFSLLDRFRILQENRPRIMDWLYCFIPTK